MPVLMGAVCFDETRTQGVAFVIDLRERKRTENELLQSEARLEKAQQVAHVGWWERDFVERPRVAVRSRRAGSSACRRSPLPRVAGALGRV